MVKTTQNGGRMSIRIGIAMLAVVMTMFGCTSLPKGVKSVTDFNLDRYLGTWYEIARLDHSFERDLHQVSAVYERKKNGTIRVLNRGFNIKTGEWKQIEGKARLLGPETIGSLKVSFFGPFYSGYHIIDIDKQGYSYAMVAGPNRSYLWILSRDKSMDKKVYSQLVAKADQMGFETEKLIRVEHIPPKSAIGSPGTISGTNSPEMTYAMTPCPSKPNCVSSLESGCKKFVRPLTYTAAIDDIRARLINILNSLERAEVVTIKDDFIHVEIKSSLFGFIDDVWFYIDEEKKLIHLKSASRSGNYDFGVNRRRIEHIRERLDL